MGSLIEADKRTARRKGMTAAAVAGGAALLFVAVNPILGVAGLVGAAYLGYDWFMFRAKRGMRF
ncbi:MAG TPA: hypothetical protein VKE22_10225 [Haliangiales bacterium]|nr:hypothetical protein [Haliangiales bacterium]